MTLGQGAVISSLLMHKINVLSSTEAELVGAHMYMPMVIWTLYFVMAQGYSIEQNIVFQDNQSTMRLQTNGMLSSTRRTKHLKARHFFMTDRIGMGEMEVQYCPTEKMWVDLLNKPKQGAAFRKDRAMLMNCPIEYDNEVERISTNPVLLNFEQELAVKVIESLPPESKPEQERRSVLDLNEARSRRREARRVRRTRVARAA